ncbi:MarR family transcriptional regulator [Sulfuracidifex tepidarius]|uniref:HTH-type transcriptional regulator lrs14 n=1 Tax=Sulfuracidifex tepidarius TaxID=1294262 RepID=A0A510E194_9CREN|nr:MarR family transcriptional regulator [Sulfuracidifex tepidarius]BBG23511.1 HTH-type transcriptional regulator lrs14 [Sulfuracidifex tepidarius]BBG26264.1 HTH-type transcriptional regulator lrs14 [Sulfuracidifex tepidarius]
MNSQIEILDTARESIKCCYKISDTDFDCLVLLAKLGRPTSSEEMASVMNLSKTTVENSLKKLLDLDLIARQKSNDESRRIGRPKFIYTVSDELLNKIKEDLNRCAETIKNSISASS